MRSSNKRVVSTPALSAKPLTGDAVPALNTATCHVERSEKSYTTVGRIMSGTKTRQYPMAAMAIVMDLPEILSSRLARV